MSKDVVLLACQPGNYADGEKEAAAIITLEHDGTIEPIVMSLPDTRKLVVGLLTALWTADDDDAEKVLSKAFSTDKDGNFQWPKEGWR